MEKQSQLLQSQTSTENANSNKVNSTELLKRIHVEETGFELIGNDEDGYFVALGSYRLTQTYTESQCRKMIADKDYELLIGLMGACVDTAIKEERKLVGDLLTREKQNTQEQIDALETSLNEIITN